jgi:hypothetical protein
MKLLAIASEPISADELRVATGDSDLVTAADDIDVLVVAPALHESALRFWMSDADEAIANAERVARQSVDALAREGVAAAGDVGESDLGAAIRDALATFPADRVIMFMHSSEDGRYREDADPGALSDELGITVERHEVRRR